MKKTLISLLVISSLASAVNVDLNLEPLKSTTGWATGHDNTTQNKTTVPTLDHTLGTLTYTNGDWSRGYAVYTLGSPITLKTTEDTLTFSMTIQTTNANSLILGTLMGDSKSLTFGHGEYSHSTKLQMGTSTVIDGTFYNMQTNVDNQGNVTHPGGTFVGDDATSADGVWKANTAITLTSKIAWSEAANGFVAKVTYGDGTLLGTTESLGQSFSLSKLSLSVDGSSSQTISNVQLSAHLVPEPATATLSLLALAGLAARRRRK